MYSVNTFKNMFITLSHLSDHIYVFACFSCYYQSESLVVCDVDEDLVKKLKQFRFRKETNNAAIISEYRQHILWHSLSSLTCFLMMCSRSNNDRVDGVRSPKCKWNLSRSINSSFCVPLLLVFIFVLPSELFLLSLVVFRIGSPSKNKLTLVKWKP